MINLAFSTNAFKRYSLEDSIKGIAKIGYRGVEILCDIPHAYPPHFKEDHIRSLKKTLGSFSIQISNLNAFTLFAIGDTYHPSWIEEDNRRRETRIQHTIECIRLAKKIGAKHLSTEPGGPVTPVTSSSSSSSSPISSQQQPRDRDRLEEIFLDGLARVAQIAEEEDIKVLIEPEPGLLIENSSQFKKLMTKKILNSKYIRLNFDIGHFYCVNEDPAKVTLELSDYVEHFHLADIAYTRIHNHLIPGRGSIDFRSVFDAIDDIGYRGFVTVELYPYQDNPIDAAKEAYDYLCNIM
jgi:sugar phosphate isomerase/epimerase